MRKKWKLIGLGLRLPPSDLDAMSGDPLECLQNSLSKWLKGIDPLPTWNALIAVLRSRVVDEEKKAQELEEKFCHVTPTLSDTYTHRQGIRDNVIKLHNSFIYDYTSISAGESAAMPPLSETSDGSETFPTHDSHEVTHGNTISH